MRHHYTRSLTWRGEPFQFERLHVRDSSDEPTEWAVSRRGEFIGTMVCGLEVTPKVFDLRCAGWLRELLGPVQR